MSPAFLLLALCAVLPADGAPAADPAPAAVPAAAVPAKGEEPILPTEEARRRRAREMALSGPDARVALVREASAGPAALRRAALEALAAPASGPLPPGAVEAALEALGASDPLLRAAGVRLLIAGGVPARERVTALLHGEGGAAGPSRLRLEEALHDLDRHRVETRFLETWGPDDGSYRGMFDGLREFGAASARTLTAIALDRRVAGGRTLGYGPYSWLQPPEESRDRTEIRMRAIEALADVGDREAREALRGAMRRMPARELFDDFDDDPVPAPVDDALRHTVAALGDTEPLETLIEVSREPGHGPWSLTVEWSRQAGAHIRIGMTREGEARKGRLDMAEDLMERVIARRRLLGLPVDGVHFYNLACLQARRDGPGDREKALANLETSIQTYSVGSEWFRRDGDLANLHGDPRFEVLCRALEARERRMREAYGLPAPDDPAGDDEGE